ncbi:MAG: glycosyltransferase family 2 protein [Bacteroidia bacterium]
MDGKNIKISVVVPVYNASKVLFELHERIKKTFSASQTPYQLIFVDDCSEDNSWDVIKEIKNRYPDEVLGIRLSKNFGQHNAIFCGFRYCTGDLVLTIDDDLQNLPEEIPLLVECQQQTGAEVVYGISSSYSRPLVRQAASRAFKTATRILSKAVGEGSSFRLLKMSLVKKLISHNQYFVFVDELISWYSSGIKFVNVTHQKSSIKNSRYTSSKLLKLYYELVIGYNATPLKTITYLGLFSSFISFIIGLYFIYRKLFFHVRIGYTSIIVSITFSAGLILLSIGIIGEHLRKMYNLLNAQPQFSVSEILE